MPAKRLAVLLTCGAAVAALLPTHANAQVRPPADPPACPASVIAGAPVLPNAVGCWNAIAVSTVRAVLPYPIQGLIYTSYPQLAVYDAVMKIHPRYAPYHRFDVPRASERCRRLGRGGGCDGRLRDTEGELPGFGVRPAGQVERLFIASLRAGDVAGVDDGARIGKAAADDLLAVRAGDKDETITYTPGPLGTGSVDVRTAAVAAVGLTPWIAVMRPFVIKRASQFRPEAPPALSSRAWRVSSTRRRPTGPRPAPCGRPTDRRRVVLQRQRSEPDQPGLPGRLRIARPRPRRRRTPDRNGREHDGRRRHRLLGRQVHLPVLAADHGDPQRRHRQQPGDHRRPDVDAAAHNAQPPRVPCGARLWDRRRG